MWRVFILTYTINDELTNEENHYQLSFSDRKGMEDHAIKNLINTYLVNQKMYEVNFINSNIKEIKLIVENGVIKFID